MGIVAAGEALAHIIAAAHLRAGGDICRFIRSGDAVFICAVCLWVGVLVPENDGESGLILTPLCRELVVVRGHGLGQILIPARKDVTGLGRRADGDGRAVACVDRLHAVAAVEVEVQQVIIPVILDVYNGAAVCGDAHGVVIQQAIAALVLFAEVAKAGDKGIGKSLARGSIRKGIAVVHGILDIVADGVVDLRGLICDRILHIAVYICHFHIDAVLVGGIADYGGADDRGGVAASRGELGRPRVGRLRGAVLKDVIYSDVICLGRGSWGRVGFIARFRRLIRINRREAAQRGKAQRRGAYAPCRRGRGLRVLRGCGGILFRGLRHGGGRCGGFLRRGGAGLGFHAVLCRGFGIGRGGRLLRRGLIGILRRGGRGLRRRRRGGRGRGLCRRRRGGRGRGRTGQNYDRLTQYIGLAHDCADRLIRGDRARQRDIAVLLIRGDGARGAARKQRNTAAVLFLIARNDNLHGAAAGLIFAVCDAATHIRLAAVHKAAHHAIADCEQRAGLPGDIRPDVIPGVYLPLVSAVAAGGGDDGLSALRHGRGRRADGNSAGAAVVRHACAHQRYHAGQHHDAQEQSKYSLLHDLLLQTQGCWAGHPAASSALVPLLAVCTACAVTLTLTRTFWKLLSSPPAKSTPVMSHSVFSPAFSGLL